ncbi:MAG: hypothetical protein FJ398_14190 [Verrucomicrobia bacterium]|nr:hypothetical protein [Verrucomicrobiota bacterium]
MAASHKSWARLSPASRVGRVPATSDGSPGRSRPTGFHGPVAWCRGRGLSCGHPPEIDSQRSGAE